jgi:glycosyltransferase involved in cell wall biosynthesis
VRIAFYAPLKSPTHGTPSGDRRVAGLIMQALALAGHRVELVSTFRSYDGQGDEARQAALRAQGISLGERMADQWRTGPPIARPDLWFTYHVYYKAPDWLGPAASARLGIPYVIAEASHAAKRAAGPWRCGHEGAAHAIASAQLLLCPSRDDIEGLRASGVADSRIAKLPPFLDPVPYRAAAKARAQHRARLAQAHALPADVPWIAVVAMMRPGDKAASYHQLAEALHPLIALPWRLLIAGDGAARAAVAALFAEAAPDRVRFLGTLSQNEVAALYAASDLCVWPAVNEAYGMAMLEAQAAGIAVVSCATRGVPDVVEHGRSGLLAAPGDPLALSRLVRELLEDEGRRARMGDAATEFAARERSVKAAAARLRALLAPLASPQQQGRP